MNLKTKLLLITLLIPLITFGQVSYLDKQELIDEASNGRGYASLTTSQKEDLNYIISQANEDMLGAVTNLQDTDQLVDFPTLYNANLAQLMRMSTTSVDSITTLSNLATVGTITSGTWQGTAIDVARQGTGTTSPTSNQVILGDGANGFKVVDGFGTSGQFLTSNGDASAPSWQSSTVNEADNYEWTGLHTFNATTSVAGLKASSTPATPLQLNGVDYAFPTTQGASSTVLATDGSGNLTWNTPQWEELASTQLAGTATGTMLANIPAREELRLIIDTQGYDGADVLYMRFNYDGTNYSHTAYQGFSLSSAGTNQPYLRLTQDATTSPMFLIVDISNLSSYGKVLSWNGTASSTYPTAMSGSGYWANTSSQITNIEVGSFGGTNLLAGTRLKLFGSKD